MNTKTMRLPPRRMLTSDKRILPRVVADKPKETSVTNPPPPPPPSTIKSILKKTPAVAPPPMTTTSAGSNQLLAGYMAHEFLNNGTLLGERWNPAEARKRSDPSDVETSEHKRRRYVEVADILRGEGAYMPGIVNPSQLARSLQL